MGDLPTDEDVISLLGYLRDGATVPEAPPGFWDKVGDQLRRRVAERRRRRDIYYAAVALAASLFVSVAPLYYMLISGRLRHEPTHLADGSGATSEIPAPLLSRILELEATRGQQDAMLAAAMSKNFGDRDNYLNGALAVYRHRSRTAARLPNLLARPAGERLEFSDAVLCYGARLLARTQQSLVPILPVNGHRLPETAGEQGTLDKETYYLAQDAVGRLCEMLRSPEENRFSEALRLAVLDYAANPQRPLSQNALRELTSSLGTAPTFLVVTVLADQGALCSGRLRFQLLDLQGKGPPDSVEVPFYWSSLPLPLFDGFPRPSQEIGNVKVTRGAGDEVVIAFTGAGGDARVFFTAPKGLPIAQRFPARLVELCFEAKLEASQDQRLPHIQFGSGGDQVFATATPPTQPAGTWQKLSIPVDLSGAELWTNGMFVQMLSLANGEKVIVHIRNAYIRSLQSPQSGKQVPLQEGSGHENVDSA